MRVEAGREAAVAHGRADEIGLSDRCCVQGIGARLPASESTAGLNRDSRNVGKGLSERTWDMMPCQGAPRYDVRIGEG